MEDKILCNVSDLSPIADAIREKENTNKLYSVEELKVKVPELISSGSEIELPILPKLNAVNGGTAASTMADAVDNTETLVGSQTNLITQIADALEGKAAGEDVSAETAEYTAQLDELESTIDSLPDAGSGGSSKKTVTITVEAMIPSGDAIRYFDELGTLHSIESGTSTIEALGGALVTPSYTAIHVTQGSAVYESGATRRLVVCREDGTTIQVAGQMSN